MSGRPTRGRAPAVGGGAAGEPLGRRNLAYLAVGAAALALMVAWAGPRRIAALTLRSNPLWLALAFLLYLAFLVLRGIRWAWLLRPLGRVTYGNTIGITLLGWFFNAFVPLRAGEFARAYLLGRREQVGVVEGVSTIAVERVLDLIAVATVGLVALRFVPRPAHLDPAIVAALRTAWALPALLIALIVAGLCFEARIVALAGGATRLLPRRWRARAIDGVRSLLRGARGLRGSPPRVAALLALSFGLWFASIAMYLAFYEALIPGPLDLPLLVPAFAIFLLSFAVTLLPANVGTYEGFFVAIFLGLGVGLPQEELLALALTTHVFSVLYVGILGGAAIAWYGASARRFAGRPSRGAGEAEEGPAAPEGAGSAK